MMAEALAGDAAAERVRPAAGPPLPELIYRRLRLDILNGVLQPGQLLRQEELARRCQVSRVPLREAMSRLEAEGLVTLRPRRGYAVTSLDPSEIVEIFELRMAIEEHAGTVAARARRPEDVAAVAALLAEMEALDPSAPEHFIRWSRLNYDFHARLIAACHRPRLARIAGALRDTVEPYIRVEARMTGEVTDADREHREILEAFRAGDARGLGMLSRRHVESTAERLLAGLRQVAVASGRPGERPAASKTARRAAQTPR